MEVPDFFNSPHNQTIRTLLFYGVPHTEFTVFTYEDLRVRLRFQNRSSQGRLPTLPS